MAGWRPDYIRLEWSDYVKVHGLAMDDPTSWDFLHQKVNIENFKILILFLLTINNRFQGNRFAVTLANSKRLFYLYGDMTNFLKTCKKVPAALDLASRLERNEGKILADLAATTISWAFVSFYWSAFSGRLRRDSFLSSMEHLKDLSEQISNANCSEIEQIIINEDQPEVQRAIEQANLLVQDGKMSYDRYLEKLKRVFSAILCKIVSHQDIKSYECPYGDEVVRHTNVECESLFGKYKFLQERFQNMAPTTLGLTTQAMVNETAQFVHQLESREVERLISNKRQSRSVARQQEKQQIDKRLQSRKARHEHVRTIFFIENFKFSTLTRKIIICKT